MTTYVEVTTTYLQTAGKTEAKIIDHDSRDDRTWLGKHCYWAMRNDCSVTTKPSEPPTPPAPTK